MAQYCLGDDDWFEFPATSGQTIEVVIATPGPVLSWTLVNANGDLVRFGDSNSPLLYLSGTTGDLDVFIVDESGDFVAGVFGSETDDKTVFHAATTSGDWRVLVGLGAAKNSYDLAVSISDGCGGLPITVDLGADGTLQLQVTTSSWEHLTQM